MSKRQDINLWHYLEYQGIKNKKDKEKRESELITSIHFTNKTRIFGKKYHIITPNKIELCTIGIPELERQFKLNGGAVRNLMRYVPKGEFGWYQNYQIKLIDDSFDRRVKYYG